MTTEWFEDVKLDVAVRLVGDDMMVRALNLNGLKRMLSANKTIGGVKGSYAEAWLDGWTITPTSQLAFARALSPIAEQKS